MKSIWLNLPVKNLETSKRFYKEIGFTLNTNYNRDDGASFLIGEKEVVLMLFPEHTFKEFVRHDVADTNKGSEILLNIGAESREEVDEMAEKVKKAGGVIFAEAAESEGWMYVFGFKDPDGHRWSMLYMDLEKLK
ncbi:VOC family protein [Cochleicola gelatinilyticus]|uniref:Extradiol dioxygenase n=1 Tax=Cochleicola gelatinilyticus TaxID=1763537 RepID=A0A167J963_9FLAO|nr:VOC family protein [Cochleicola gelatinilyticus]OAB80446.1 extradiol dioxygenase [Cochleicola gelatinilyticus]